MSSYVDSHTKPGKGRNYDQFYQTDHWARYAWSREQRILPQIVEEFFPRRHVNLLDFACGTGRISSVLEDHVSTCTGVDVSEAMLEVAHQKLYKTELIKGNIIDDDVFPGRTFNMITAFRFFVNAEQGLREAAMRVLRRHLADDGILVFNDHQNHNAMFTRVVHTYARARGLALTNTLTIEQCRRLVEPVGMEIIRVYPIGLFHLPRIPLPHPLYRVFDIAAERVRGLARYSESPILVAAPRGSRP
jgi:ubiquinone/menaquinone biosynthesis C-methylase UbiE